MTGELAFIVGEEKDALLVPRQAVQGDAVWVVRDGKLAKADVTVGRKNVERVEIAVGAEGGRRGRYQPVGRVETGQRSARMLDADIAAGLNKAAKKADGPMKFNLIVALVRSPHLLTRSLERDWGEGDQRTVRIR